MRNLLLVILWVISFAVRAQHSDTDPFGVYGPDQLLCNGKLYSLYPPASTMGNQFFAADYVTDGSVKIRGFTFTGLQLNYDIYNQQLVLKYINASGLMNLIALSDAWLEEFNLGASHFEMIAAPDTLYHIFQVLGTGKYRVAYSWIKTMTLENRYMASNQVFSAAKKEMNILFDNHLVAYKNNRSFIAIFEPAVQPEIKKHLRQQHINVRKASDPVITELINYGNSLNPK